MTSLEEARKAAGSMFAGHTGLSREQIRAYFHHRVKKHPALPDTASRRELFLACLEQLPNKDQVAVLRSLLEHPPRMQHGYPTSDAKRELHAFLDEL